MAAKRPLLIILPILSNLITLILLILLLLSGLNGRLTNLYWLSTSTDSFSTPSKLSSSPYLTALTNLSKTDYTGPPSTAASLGLPAWSSIHLLTSCSHFPSGGIECTPPQYGFVFSPGKHLKLDSSSLQGQSSPALDSALDTYASASKWLSAGYTASAVFSLLAPIQGWIWPGHWAAVFTAGLGGVVVLAATVTATVVFRRVAEAINEQFGSFGLTASAGTGAVVVGFTAALLMGVAAGGYWVVSRKVKDRGGMLGSGGPRAFGDGGKMGLGQDSEYHGAAGKGGLLGRVTGQRHKYVQIGEQTGATPNREGNTSGSPDGMRPNGLDDDWAAPDEYAGAVGVPAAGKTSSGPGALIPLMALGGGNKQTRDRGTAFEPFSEPR